MGKLFQIVLLDDKTHHPLNQIEQYEAAKSMSRVFACWFDQKLGSEKATWSQLLVESLRNHFLFIFGNDIACCIEGA